MHELSIVQYLCEQAERYAKENQAEHVKFVEVEIGEMTGVIPKYVHMYYPDVTAGTVLEGSELRIEESKAIAWCRNCGSNYHIEDNSDRSCPECGAFSYDILQGNKLVLKQIGFV